MNTRGLIREIAKKDYDVEAFAQLVIDSETTRDEIVM